MKKITFIVLISLGTFLSCNKNLLNENDPISIGEKIFEGFSKSDSSIIWSLYDFNSESKYLKAFREVNTMPEINSILKSGGKSKLVKIDTVGFLEKPLIEVTFIKDLNFYKISAGYYLDSIENKIRIDSYTIVDLTKYCIEYFESPYLPIEKVVGVNFLFKAGSDNLHFKLGELDIINNTDSDIDMIRFRLKIFHVNSKSPVFNQTIESNISIRKGDMKRIDIIELQDYFIGKIINDKTITFDFELIEVSPKPINAYCEMLSNIKN